MLDLNLENINKSTRGLFKIKMRTFPLLEMHANNFMWDNNLSKWTILNPQTGIRSDLNYDYVLYSLQGINLLEEQLGVTWNGKEWVFPNGYLPRKVMKQEWPQLP